MAKVKVGSTNHELRRARARVIGDLVSSLIHVACVRASTIFQDLETTYNNLSQFNPIRSAAMFEKLLVRMCNSVEGSFCTYLVHFIMIG